MRNRTRRASRDVKFHGTLFALRRFDRLLLIAAGIVFVTAPLLGACGKSPGSVSTALEEVTSASTQPASQPTSGTPATASDLPETVTANGIAITLQSVDATNTSTRLTFTIHLPADIAGSSEPDVLGPIFPTDVQIKGVKVRPNDPLQSGTGHAPGQSTQSISMTYGPVTDPTKTVTFDLVRLRLSLTPTNPNTIQGPWTFQITSGMLQASPLPTPNHLGLYQGISIAQAQELVAFSVIEPVPLPDVLKPLPEYSVTASPIGSTGSAKANYVTFFYPAMDMAEKGVSVLETTAGSAVPTIQDGALHWVDQRGTETTLPTSELSQAKLTIMGATVTKIDTTQQGAHIVYLLWDNAAVHFVVYTILGPQVTESVMEQFVSAMMAPSGDVKTPTAGTSTHDSTLPTPDVDGQIVLTFEQAQQLASFHLAKPTWLPSYLKYRGVIVPEWQGAEPAGSPFQLVMLIFDPQSLGIQLNESSTNVPKAFLGGSTPTTETIAGHSITRTNITSLSGSQIEDYRWQDQGTTFELTASTSRTVTVQDLEEIIASMLGR